MLMHRPEVSGIVTLRFVFANLINQNIVFFRFMLYLRISSHSRHLNPLLSMILVTFVHFLMELHKMASLLNR